ncbi:albusnodin/ikarugamycin family macrolactam cyclase [Streptomyces sp. NPDC057877]|uniref:albusnodin/ikarugamycin family macrolactam cyclase n=1 Tax=Streptomyces sp. NPDC057877 TaxID=3346269 RepID=UPI003674AF38
MSVPSHAAPPAARDPRLTPGPAIAGFLPPTGHLPSRPADRVWSTDDRLWSWGTWYDGEVSGAECARARLVAVGRCLADPQRMREDLERSVRDGHWERLTRWPGAYLLLVAEDGGRVTAYTDPAGQFPLHYAARDGRTVVSTLATAVAAFAGTGGTPDPAALAAHIVCPSVPELVEGRSAFAGVRRLGPGEALRVEPSGAVTRWTYARPGPVDGVGFEEAAARLRSALTWAVTLRTRGGGRVTSDLSGGMDSTSLAFLAADLAPEPLDAFVYHHPDAPAGDLDHALRHAGVAPRIRLHVTRGDGTSLPYRRMEARGVPDQPDPATATVTRLRLRLAHIAREGGTVHLTGEGGDALLAAPPAFLGDLAASAGLRRLLRDAHALGRLRHVSPAAVALRALRLARTPMDSALRELAVRIENPLSRPVQWPDAIAWWPPPGPEAAWLTGRARRDLAELARERAESERRDPTGLTPGTRAVLAELHNSAALHGQLVDVARDFGVWPQAPFLDGDVVRACLSLPVTDKADPFTVKPLLAAALGGLVPGPVLRRRTKGDYAAEDHLGVRRSAADLRARLTRSPLADLGIVEPSRVIASLDRAAAGLPAPFPALNRLLGVDLWMSARDRGEEAVCPC